MSAQIIQFPSHSDGGPPEEVVLRIEGLDELNRSIESLNDSLDDLPEPPKTRGWFWFALGALLGLNI